MDVVKLKTVLHIPGFCDIVELADPAFLTLEDVFGEGATMVYEDMTAKDYREFAEKDGRGE